MKRAAVWTGAALLAGLAAWQAASALQDTPEPTAPAATEASPPSPETAEPAPQAEAPKAKSAPALNQSKAVTPMAERVATLGVLNKRNGLSRDLTMKPGEAVRIGDRLYGAFAVNQTNPDTGDTKLLQILRFEAPVYDKR